MTAGGDDYITKPFSVEEIALRVRTIVRRTRAAARLTTSTNPDHNPPHTDACPRPADITLDEDAHEVRRAGRVVDLSPTEFNPLRYLMVNAERVVSKAQILDRVWSYDYAGDSRIVESSISYLRRKLDGDGGAVIHTVRGMGYSLRQAVQRDQPVRTPPL